MPDTSTARTNLRSAITKLQAERSHLTSLQNARERAQEQRWKLGSRLREAQFELGRAEADESRRLALAHAYASGEDRDGITPVEAAKATLDRVQAENIEIERVEDALDREIPTVSNRVQQAQNAVYGAMAQIMTTSPEYRMLLQQHTQAWKQLRTVKEALRVVVSALHGNAPKSAMDEPFRSEPTEIRIGFDVNREVVGAWQHALASLETDADATLPLL